MTSVPGRQRLLHGRLGLLLPDAAGADPLASLQRGPPGLDHRGRHLLSVQRHFCAVENQAWGDRLRVGAQKPSDIPATNRRPDEEDATGSAPAPPASPWYSRLARRIAQSVDTWRNLSPEQDPALRVSLRVYVPVLLICIIYALCRVFIYVEDFIGLRSQPAEVYVTVNRFIPFLSR